MADTFVTIDLQPIASFQQTTPTAAIQARMANPGPAVAQFPAIMRRGPGSIEDQRVKGMTIGRIGRAIKWPPAKPFGTDKPGPEPLFRRGRYVAAWQGGPGGFTNVTETTAAIGVVAGEFPQARVFQRDVPTFIKVTPKMRVYLGLNKGVWLKKSTTQLRVDPRAFSVNPEMTRRARQVLINYFINGRATEYAVGSFAA